MQVPESNMISIYLKLKQFFSPAIARTQSMARMGFILLPFSATLALSSTALNRYLKLTYQHHLPDPVNVETGNFFLPLTDISLSCFGPKITVERTYNSLLRSDGIFGPGWHFNHGLKLIFGKDDIQLVEPDGYISRYTPDIRPMQAKAMAQELVKIREQEDKRTRGKPKETYQDYFDKLVSSPSFLIKQVAQYLGDIPLHQNFDRFKSIDRGTYYLNKDKDGYFVRTHLSGTQQTFMPNGLIRKIEDPYGNALSFHYAKADQLTSIRDSCNQAVHFKYDRTDHVVQIVAPRGQIFTYAYDKNGLLTTVTHPNKDTMTYAYDKLSRMTSIIFGTKDKVFIAYDPQSGRVTQQTGPGDKKTLYTYAQSQGSFKTTVKETGGDTLSYAFISALRQIIFRKGSTQTTTTVNDCCGKPVSIVNAQQKGEFFTYDAQHRLIQIKQSTGPTLDIDYKDDTRLPSVVTSSDGSSRLFAYNAQESVTQVTLKQGNKTQNTIDLNYNARGVITRVSSTQDGYTFEIGYTPLGQYANVTMEQKGKISGRLKFHHDAEGTLKKVLSTPSGQENVILDQLMRLTRELDINHLSPYFR